VHHLYRRGPAWRRCVKWLKSPVTPPWLMARYPIASPYRVLEVCSAQPKG
jgi:hypothetical protein